MLRTTNLRFATVLAAAVAGLFVPARGAAQVAGQNINMVSGTQWPGGDPFLQRQNEPSLAVSSRNPLYLVAGANDYRTVDLPTEPGSVPGTLSGDAWLGVFKSFDGGQSWQSTLLPGYPQDKSAIGMASPLKAYAAAADPTVRAGANGLVYYSGMAFNRGTNIGAVFLTRYFDLNNTEYGDAADPSKSKDPIAYVDTKLIDTGTSGQFLDKPWLAVDFPRSGSGAMTCSFTPAGAAAQSFVGGNVYMTWSRFTGSASTKIMFSRSLDCGKTWSTPIKISESNSINQGTNIAVDPKSGAVYIAWRRFATSSQPDAIVVAQSTDFGKTFASKNTVQVATISPLDQGTSGTRFRTNALPSIAVSVDSSNTSRVHVAWAQRNSSNQDAQIVVATSPDGLNWSAPLVPVDGLPITDDGTGSFGRGHQFMPQLTFSQGRLMVLYYDQRLDHTLGFYVYTPGTPVLGDGMFQGNYTYKLFRNYKGELPANPQQVFTLNIDDAFLTVRRHTVDLRVAEAVPGSTLTFSAATVSQYKFGLRALDVTATPTGLDQLEDNPPNLPLFAQGTVPFLGDYIDIAGQTIVPNGSGGWKFNTDLTSAPVFYATWTDNRDVVPPRTLNAQGFPDWTNYTPPGSTSTGVQSVLDPTKTTSPCVPGNEGMRNQNIYSSRITEGLLVSSPQNVKPLSSTLQRAFVVTLQNYTGQQRTFHMTITSPQPAGGWASFTAGANQPSLAPPSPVVKTLDVTVEAHSGAARPVFATSTNPAASITVNVVDDSGLSGSIVLNPEGSVSALVQPDGTTPDMSIGGLEVYTPSFEVWNANNTNPFLNIGNPDLSILNIGNLNIGNAAPILNIGNSTTGNLNIGNLNIGNTDPANLNIGNLNIGNATAANLNIGNLNIGNLNIGNLNIGNTAVSDVSYSMKNVGNTTHSYRVALYGNNPNKIPVQLIVTKNSTTPTSVNCSLQSLPQGVVVATVNNAQMASALPDATSPNITDSSVTNATVSLKPGERLFVTVRAALTLDQMAQFVKQMTPVITAHGANTNGVANDFAALLFIQTTSGVLPAAVVGVPYNGTGYPFQSSGGAGTITWTTTGTLPGGLTLSPSGLLSGTPSGSGTFTFNVTASDGSPTPETSTQTISMTVAARKTSTTPTLSKNPIVAGEVVSVNVIVADSLADGTASSPTGTVTLSGDPGLSATTCTLAPSAPGASTCSVTVTPASSGPRSISASYPGTSVHMASGGSVGLTVNPAATTTAVTSSGNPSTFGQAVTFTATVLVTAPGAGTPTGTVTFLDNGTSIGTGTLSAGGVATFSTSSLAVATHSVTASYSGDSNFGGSTSPVLSQVANKATSTTALAATPNPSTFGQSVTFTATVTSSAGTPTGTVTFLDGAATIGTVTLNAGGVATFSTPSLSVTSHSITASYSGDPSFNGSTSAAISQVVNKATSATVLSATPNPSNLGQSVTFTATVTGPGGTPGGTVTFLDGATTLGSGTLNGSGVATFSTSALLPGGHSIVAGYSGNASFLSSSSAVLTQTVNKGATAIALATAPNPSVFGQAVTLSATVTTPVTGVAAPTGSVTFFDGSTAVGTAPVTGVLATLSTSALSIGSHAITATYLGDANYGGSSSGTVTQVVNIPPYTFTGFGSPLSTAGTLSSPTYSGTQNIGSATPIKYQLNDYLGNIVSDLSSTTSIQAIPNPNCSGAPSGQSILLYSPTVGATGGSTFRFSSPAFTFNWDTSVVPGPGCYTIVLQLNDTSAPRATTIKLQ